MHNAYPSTVIGIASSPTSSHYWLQRCHGTSHRSHFSTSFLVYGNFKWMHYTCTFQIVSYGWIWLGVDNNIRGFPFLFSLTTSVAVQHEIFLDMVYSESVMYLWYRGILVVFKSRRVKEKMICYHACGYRLECPIVLFSVTKTIIHFVQAKDLIIPKEFKFDLTLYFLKGLEEGLRRRIRGP